MLTSFRSRDPLNNPLILHMTGVESIVFSVRGSRGMLDQGHSSLNLTLSFFIWITGINVGVILIVGVKI